MRFKSHDASRKLGLNEQVGEAQADDKQEIPERIEPYLAPDQPCGHGGKQNQRKKQGIQLQIGIG